MSLEFYTEKEDDILKIDVDFEKFHPKNLRWSHEDRRYFFEIIDGKALWMIVDDEVIGEILWEKYDSKGKIAYIDSFSIKKEEHGKGYGSLFKQVFYNILKNSGYKEVRGHAKDGKSWNISKKMGAKLIKTYENYEGTGLKYHYYKQKL